MIITKPRQIRIDLDPDHGFPVAVFIETTRHVEEGGVKIADLPSHIDTLAPDSPQAVGAIGEMASAATAALLRYQEEVQRLAQELNTIRGIR